MRYPGRRREDKNRCQCAGLRVFSCADLTEISETEIISIAKQAMGEQVMDIADAINDVAKRHGRNTIIACGLGEFLIKRLRKSLDLRFSSYRRNMEKNYQRCSLPMLWRGLISGY